MTPKQKISLAKKTLAREVDHLTRINDASPNLIYVGLIARLKNVIELLGFAEKEM